VVLVVIVVVVVIVAGAAGLGVARCLGAGGAPLRVKNKIRRAAATYAMMFTID